MSEEVQGVLSEVRESAVSKNDGDNRYTQVDNDILLNPIEGFKPETIEEEKEENNHETQEKEKEKEKENKTQGETISNSMKRNKIEIRIILLGEKGVGKTSLINRYVNNKFNSLGEASTGPDEKKKKFELDNKTLVELLIKDTTNEEKLGKFTKTYYKDAHGALVVFDITNHQSFDKVKYWLEELNGNAPRDIVICIIGNKADLSADKNVTIEEIQNIAGDNLHYEVSAKSGNNVSLAFEQLTYGIVEKQKEEEKNPNKVVRGKDGRKTTDLRDINKDLAKKKKCC